MIKPVVGERVSCEVEGGDRENLAIFTLGTKGKARERSLSRAAGMENVRKVAIFQVYDGSTFVYGSTKVSRTCNGIQDEPRTRKKVSVVTSERRFRVLDAP